MNQDMNFKYECANNSLNVMVYIFLFISLNSIYSLHILLPQACENGKKWTRDVSSTLLTSIMNTCLEKGLINLVEFKISAVTSGKKLVYWI